RDLLKDLLKDDRVAVRLRAALALGALKGEDSVAALKGALSDPDASVIVGVLRGLGRTQSDQAVQILSAMDPKDDPDLKRARVLGLFEASRGVRERSVVLSMLSAPALNDRNQAHEALVALTGERFDYDPLKGEEHGKAVADRYLEWWKTRP
ncbi:MAG TPA: HEAT repeat domain-containing protein, partial [Planctomycetota bacterium]|nr:HEAT repeat domain-containing protein [Planctomycetota bacterium]